MRGQVGATPAMDPFLSCYRLRIPALGPGPGAGYNAQKTNVFSAGRALPSAGGSTP